MKDNARYGQSSPGIGVEAAQFLASKEVVMVGSENWGVEVSPNPNPELAVPVHQLLIAQYGIDLHENLNTEELARDSVYEFMYMFSPLRFKAATGSPGNPIAIRGLTRYRIGEQVHVRQIRRSGKAVSAAW